MIDQSADVAKQVENVVEGTGKFIKPDLIVDSAQFGKKVGKHAQDFGLNPALQSSRDFVRNHIDDIYTNADEIRTGMWRGLGDVMENGNRADGMANFFRKGNDVVVTDTAGNFVTILKDGATQNTRFKGAEIIFGGN